MTYAKQEWTDGPEGGTPINKVALDHIEQGIEDAGLPAWITEDGGQHNIVSGITSAAALTDAAALAGSFNGIMWSPGSGDGDDSQGVDVFTGANSAYHMEFKGDGILKVDGVPVQVGTPAAPAGVSIVRAFPFAFDTPGILTGAVVYTHGVGEMLLNAWIKITQAWDGTTPTADFGHYAAGHGLLREINNDMFTPWKLNDPGYLKMQMSYAQMAAISDASWLLTVAGGFLVSGDMSDVSTYVPNLFHPEVPEVKICVSQDGTNTGADPGSTQGSGILYLVTATPA